MLYQSQTLELRKQKCQITHAPVLDDPKDHLQTWGENGLYFLSHNFQMWVYLDSRRKLFFFWGHDWEEYQALPQIIPTWHKWWSHHMHLALWTLSALWHCIITSHIGSRKRMKQTIKIAVDRMSFIKTNNSRIEINAIKPCPRFHSLIFFYLVLLPFSSSSFHTEVNITKGLLQSCYLAILRLQDFINTEGLNQRSFFKKHPVLTFEVLKRGKKCYYLK